MSRWTKTDNDLAQELAAYVSAVRLYGASSQWTIRDEGKPWTVYYEHGSSLFRKMRPSRRNRIGGK